MEKKSFRTSKRKGLQLSQALLLEEHGVPRLIRYVIVTLTLVVGAFLLWASVTRIDEVAVAVGEIIPSGHIKRIQHEDGGLVSSIVTQEGESVVKGQELLTMDPTVSVSNLDQFLARRTSLQLRKERLQAHIENRTPDYSGIEAKFAEAVAQQEYLHAQKIESMNAANAILKNQINQYEAELEELVNRENTLRQQYDLTQEEYSTYERLFEKELVGKTEFFDIKRQFLQIQEYLNQIPVRRIQVGEKLTESENRLIKLQEEARESWMAEVALVEAETSEVQEIIKRYEQDVSQLSIKAPEDGVVHNLQVHSPGEVIQPGATILEIVPAGKNLVAEVRISSRDVGHVEEGQAVTVKFTAYDFARYGGMQGTLSDISPTTIMDEQGAVYYKGIVTLDASHLAGSGKNHQILPGMTIQADIKTGEKTLIGYLFKPIQLSLQQAFRER